MYFVSNFSVSDFLGMALHCHSIVKNNLKTCYWNTGGINTPNINKVEDPIFIQEIQEYDVFILAETHIVYNANLHVGGFNYFLFVEIF